MDIRKETIELSQKDRFPLVRQGLAAKIFIDSEGADYDGLRLVAASFARDVELVSGVTPAVETELGAIQGTAVYAGTIGQHRVIDALIAENRIDAAAIRGKRESYVIQHLEQPLPGVEQAIFIVGSDKRGTIYGIYHISELIGVSPWVYWADVPPPQQDEIWLPLERLRYTSKEPAIKYRGFFINDEWPSFGSWTNNRFGGFNEDMYAHVFELLLRLKGNYLWPAMWSAVFSEDGKSKPTANAELAHAYGIVMGTSHHEPMFRAGEEWGKVYKQYTDRYDWDFMRNEEAITRFWEDGVKRNRQFESMITLGMRGERDSALGGSIADNIQLLKNIILTQKELLRKYGLEHAPQSLVIYKEVERFWHGTAEVPGLKHWEVLDDVTIMLSDDNFANVRTLPGQDERHRSAGWGLYYHFDYHGGPVSYEWVNVTPLQKIWEQMTMAYDYGIRELWIVNVGDLKPMELPLSYFMALAYDYETWGTHGLNRADEFMHTWCRQQFGHAVQEEAVIDGIAQVLTAYTRMNGDRKPEVTYPNTYSLTHDREADRVLAKAIQLEQDAERYKAQVAATHRDAYYQLVYYPAAASANVKKMQIYAAYYDKYAKRSIPSALANRYAGYVEEAIAKDIRLQGIYNEELSGGKWRGIMSSPHVGYVHWNADGWHYPEVKRIDLCAGSKLIVDTEKTEDGILTGLGSLPPFTNLMREEHSLTISNGGRDSFACTVDAEADWILIAPRSDHSTAVKPLKLSHQWQGLIEDGVELDVSVDWSRVSQSASTEIVIQGAEQTVRLHVDVEVIDVSIIPEETFVEAQGCVSIEAEHTMRSVAVPQAEWKVIEGYGRTLSSLKMFPTTVSFDRAEDAPYLEYRVWLRDSRDYTLTVYAAPSNPLAQDSKLRYAVSFNGTEPVIADALPDDYRAGESASWAQAVLDNAHRSTTVHRLNAGLHTLRVYGLDAGLVLQKLVISQGTAMPASYYGPPESFRTSAR